jgi:glycosyltransferase involved in cell wall biosynthesis
MEQVLSDLKRHLPADIEYRTAIVPLASRGMFRRLYNIIEAALRQGDVNHITGDVHYLALLLAKKRTILTIHDCGYEHSQAHWKRIVQRLLWLHLPVRRAQWVTTISEATKQEVLSFVNCEPSRIRVIPNCVSTDLRSRPKSFNTQGPRILQIGAGPNKNLTRLIAAVEGLRCHLDIVGVVAPPDKQALARTGTPYTESLNLSREEIVQKYEACDMVTFVSTYEGFGMPIVEANAIGRPVVTSNLSPMKEVAADAARLVDPFDIADIRDGILRVISDQAFREQLIRNGLRNAQRYHPSVIAGQYASLYREIYRATNSRAQMNCRTTEEPV